MLTRWRRRTRRRAARVDAAVAAASPSAQSLTDALWSAADLGVDGSVPRAMTDDGPATLDALLAQARSVADDHVDRLDSSR